MLPRVVGRSHDLAVRMALGATQRQVVQHVVIETVLMAVVAACGGLGLAYWASAIVSQAMLGNMLVAANLNTAPDLRVLGFTAAITGGAGLLSAAAPAWLMTRSDPRALLQHYSQLSAPSRVGIRGLLFGIGPHDPMVWVVVPVVLLIVAMCACLVPAFRAAAIDPSNWTADRIGNFVP